MIRLNFHSKYMFIVTSILLLKTKHASSECYEHKLGDFCSSIDDLKTRRHDLEAIEIIHNGPKHFVDSTRFKNFEKLKKLKLASAFYVLEVEAFVELKSLDVLEIVNNSMGEIHNLHFKNLPIRELILTNNKIRYIRRNSFSNLPNLVRLDLSDNALVILYRGVFSSLPVEDLIIRRNQLSRIQPGAMSGSENLKTLVLSENELTEFNATDTFGSGNYTLINLEVNSNKIKKLDIRVFPKLKFLNGANNEISKLEDGAFEENTALSRVRLPLNHIKELQPNIIPIDGLQILNFDVSLNRLSYLDEEFLIRLPRLTHVSVCGNPWQCPCYELITKWLLKRSIINICDYKFTDGTFPVCIYTEDFNQQCNYNINLYDDYKKHVNLSAIGSLSIFYDSYIQATIGL